MIIKHSGSRKWINEQKTNSVLFHNNNLSAIWYSPSSHRSRAGLQNAEWLGLLLCPARPQICTHSVHRKWPGSWFLHSTPWFLASLASLAQSSLILRLTAALLLLCQIRNVWLSRSGRCSQKQVGGQLCFSDRTLQILTPWKDLPPTEAPWPPAEEQPCGCAWHVTMGCLEQGHLLTDRQSG